MNHRSPQRERSYREQRERSRHGRAPHEHSSVREGRSLHRDRSPESWSESSGRRRYSDELDRNSRCAPRRSSDLGGLCAAATETNELTQGQQSSHMNSESVWREQYRRRLDSGDFCYEHQSLKDTARYYAPDLQVQREDLERYLRNHDCQYVHTYCTVPVLLTQQEGLRSCCSVQYRTRHCSS